MSKVRTSSAKTQLHSYLREKAGKRQEVGFHHPEKLCGLPRA